MRHIRKIIVHCSATRPEMHSDWSAEQWVAEIDRWHKRRGWSGVGYHYIIARDGSVAEGRPVWKAGAHAKGQNKDSIGICLIGGHGSRETDDFRQHYTPEQERALRALLAKLLHEHKLPERRLYGHNEFSAKACPGFRVKRWWKGEPSARQTFAASTTAQATAAAAVSAAAAVRETAQSAGGVIEAISALDRTAQIILVVSLVVLAGALGWVLRERWRRWVKGDR